jgi:hypothetical protein
VTTTSLANLNESISAARGTPLRAASVSARCLIEDLTASDRDLANRLDRLRRRG